MLKALAKSKQLSHSVVAMLSSIHAPNLKADLLKVTVKPWHGTAGQKRRGVIGRRLRG
jgi:hypothetical protein